VIKVNMCDLIRQFLDWIYSL